MSKITTEVDSNGRSSARFIDASGDLCEMSTNSTSLLLFIGMQSCSGPILIDQETAAEMIPILQRFAVTGRLDLEFNPKVMFDDVVASCHRPIGFYSNTFTSCHQDNGDLLYAAIDHVSDIVRADSTTALSQDDDIENCANCAKHSDMIAAMTGDDDGPTATTEDITPETWRDRPPMI